MGRPNTAETRKKISASLKAYYAEHGHPCEGRVVTQEHRDNVSKALKARYAEDPKPGRPQTEETKKKLSEAAQRSRALARADHLPERRQCAKCKTYKPAKEFYIYYRKLVCGEKVPHLYPRCRKCESERSRAYVLSLPIEERRRREAKYKRDMRKRRRKGHDPLVPAKPFVEWFLSFNGSTPTENEMGEAVARAVRRAINGSSDSRPLEERKIKLSTVDHIGVLVGETYLVHTLYGGM